MRICRTRNYVTSPKLFPIFHCHPFFRHALRRLERRRTPKLRQTWNKHGKLEENLIFESENCMQNFFLVLPEKNLFFLFLCNKNLILDINFLLNYWAGLSVSPRGGRPWERRDVRIVIPHTKNKLLHTANFSNFSCLPSFTRNFFAKIFWLLRKGTVAESVTMWGD